MEQGKLIILEGPDGVGKSSLANELAKHLRKGDVEVDCLSFPGQDAGTLGRLIYALHHDPASHEVQSINPTSLQLLHIAAHIEAIDNTILPKLRSGRWIILDRYWWSTYVYGFVYGVRPECLQAMIDIERNFWGDVVPFVCFLVYRSCNAILEGNEGNLGALSAEYQSLAEREKEFYPVRIIQNDGQMSDTLNLVLWEINNLTTSLEYAGTQSHEIADLSESIEESQDSAQLEMPFSTSIVTAIKRVAPCEVFLKYPSVILSEVYDTYWRFAAERQAIFFRKLRGAPFPWTEDPILTRHKFTNAYRASDRVSQYLIKHVIYEKDQSPEEVFFRIILFKLFNRIDTWQLLENELGEISYANYDFKRYDPILSAALEENTRIYSAAYIMPSATTFGFRRKHRNHLRLLEMMMDDEVPLRIADARSMEEAFSLLRSYPMLGDFLAYQYAIDVNYSELTGFSEMDFVVPGPGARDGLRKCFYNFGGLTDVEIIRMMADNQEKEFARLNLEFQSLWGRPLQLVDCQNLFCEVDKYARLAHPEIKGITGRTRIKQSYEAGRESVSYWYPPKWKVNHLIQ